jgi:hypothetical protein
MGWAPIDPGTFTRECALPGIIVKLTPKPLSEKSGLRTVRFLNEMRYRRV